MIDKTTMNARDLKPPVQLFLTLLQCATDKAFVSRLITLKTFIFYYVNSSITKRDSQVVIEFTLFREPPIVQLCHAFN